MRRGLEVVDPGLLTTVQDWGRPGYAHLGVPRSGALDHHALSLAQRLVGNLATSAALEVTLTGCTLRAYGTLTVAVTGAFTTVEIDGHHAAWGSRLVVPDGALVRLGAAQYGARSILAVAGGVDIEPVLGSRSSDMLSGLGPAPLAAGDVLPVGAEGGVSAVWVEVPFSIPRRQLRLLPGPHRDWCDPSQLASTWIVGTDSNRVGLRLEGAAVGRRPGEISSFPMITGAVQLPPSGQPIVLLADHATTGGYPVVAVVCPDDLDACGQLRPGDEVTTSWQ